MIVTGVVMRVPFEKTIGTLFQENILEQRSSHVKMVLMATKGQRAERRTDALSKERIVEAAIEILDADGESALTFRALAARLATGSGAIYWHVANKNDLLAAATDDVIARVMTEVASGAEPQEAIRAIALGVFDAIDAHPWVGTQLSREPWQSAMLQIFEGIGGQLQALGVPGTGAVRLRVRARELHPRPRRTVRRGRPPPPARDGSDGLPRDRRRTVGAARPRGVPVRASGGGAAARARRPRAVPRRHRPHPGRHHNSPIGKPSRHHPPGGAAS